MLSKEDRILIKNVLQQERIVRDCLESYPTNIGHSTVKCLQHKVNDTKMVN